MIDAESTPRSVDSTSPSTGEPAQLPATWGHIPTRSVALCDWTTENRRHFVLRA